jgi:hypothetical protein
LDFGIKLSPYSGCDSLIFLIWEPRLYFYKNLGLEPLLSPFYNIKSQSLNLSVD